MSCAENRHLSRRGLIAGGTSLAMWGMLPRTASAGPARDPRLLCVVLRGGLDGLSLAAPVGDPNYELLRGPLALPRSGEGAGLPLDGFFVLNASMPNLHRLYQKGEALIVHAAATPYRARSHFDGQDVLESGMPGVGRVDDGWLNRALLALPAAGRVAPSQGLAMGAVMPLVMRGKAPVLNWIGKANSLPLRESTIARLMDLYAETDPKLAQAFAKGIEMERMSDAQAKTAAPRAPAGAAALPRQFPVFIEAAEAAARFLTASGGPRIGALAYGGWDTHANEGAVKGQLANQLSGLDHAIGALSQGLGSAWRQTVVAIVTEFGRTARINGTAGTDHGTATVAVLVGGAVKGGRVLADWPGLAEGSLHEGRDLKPTRDLRSVFKGVLRDHLGVPVGVLDTTVFPESRATAAADGIVA